MVASYEILFENHLQNIDTQGDTELSSLQLENDYF